MARLETAMLAVFHDLDDGTLRVLAALPTRRKPRPRGQGMRRHGRVSVRHEQPATEPSATPAELLKAAAIEDHNWAWGQDERIGRHRQHN